MSKLCSRSFTFHGRQKEGQSNGGCSIFFVSFQFLDPSRGVHRNGDNFPIHEFFVCSWQSINPFDQTDAIPRLDFFHLFSRPLFFMFVITLCRTPFPISIGCRQQHSIQVKLFPVHDLLVFGESSRVSGPNRDRLAVEIGGEMA